MAVRHERDVRRVRSGSSTRASTRDARAATSSTVSPGVSPGTTPSSNTVQVGSPSVSRISAVVRPS